MSPDPESAARNPLRIALVIGVSHSGSTMLDLTLGSHPEIVGVGEVYNFGRRWRNEVQAGLRMPCVCGVDVSECELWGAVVSGAKGCASPEESIRHTYGELTDRFSQLWPNGVLLDSSKKLDSIRLIRELPDVDLRVLLVVRDVRGWVASARDRHRTRYGRRMVSADLSPRARVKSLMGKGLANVPTLHATDWYRRNLQYLEQLDEWDVPYHVVSYEWLCFQTDEVLTEIAEFLDIEPLTSLSPADSGSHIVNGNHVRLDPERRGRLSYDTRWMRRLDAQIPYLLLPRVRRLNNRLVWGDASSTPGRPR
jgi:hypothetical protein